MGYGKGCTYDSKRDFEKYKINGFYTGFVMEGKSLYKCFLMAIVLLSSCTAQKKVLYLQDVKQDTILQIQKEQEIKIQPNDLLSIIVNSRDPELVSIFNLPEVRLSAGQGTSAASSQIQGHLVDADGDINFPILGRIYVGGLTRDEVADEIEKLLKSGGYVNDAVVLVKFLNFKISVIGEVNHPGTYNVSSDRITLFEALSLAGDLTIYGKRDRVMVIREVNGNRQIVYNDLRSKSVFDSPAYYLQQNDMVYVEPNKYRAGQTNINQNNSVGLWISVASFLTTIAVLIFK